MNSKSVEELDLYKEYRHAYDKATELEFFDKQQEADYYYEYAQQLKKKIDNGETTLTKLIFRKEKNDKRRFILVESSKTMDYV